MKVAVSECDPAASDPTTVEALPEASATGVPNAVAPSLNCTLPTAFDGTTVADSETDCPTAVVALGPTASAVVVVVSTTALME